MRITFSRFGAGRVVAGNVPVNTVPPQITGLLAVGSVLTMSDGSWTNSPTSFDKEWRRNGISTGFTGNTYTVTENDAGAFISGFVVAKKAGVASIGQLSNTVGPVAQADPNQALATLITAFANVGVTMSAQRQSSARRCIERLQTSGIWPKLRGLWLIGNGRAESRINWKQPGTNDLTEVGAPTFTAPNVGATGAPSATGGFGNSGSIANYLDTGIPLNSVNQNDFSFGVFHRMSSNYTLTNDVAGAIDGSGNGISIKTSNGGTGTGSVRAMGAEVTSIGTQPVWYGPGWHGVSRTAPGAMSVYRSAVAFENVTSASVTITSSTTLTFLKANGAGTAGAGAFGGGFLTSEGLSTAEMRQLQQIMQNYIDSVCYGDVAINRAGQLPLASTADVVVYGWTWQGVAAAIEAARQGRTVALVGGWNDHTVNDFGGVTANGLGFVDFRSNTIFTGIARTMTNRVGNFGLGTVGGQGQVAPLGMNLVCRNMLDPARNGGLPITVWETNGITAALKTGTRITSITTEDGRSFAGKYFIDCSYEGDLMAKAGCSFATGREAAGSGGESVNGWQGFTSAGQIELGGSYIRVDPFVTPGDQSSGLIPTIFGTNPGYTFGQPVDSTQSFTFRLTFTTLAGRQRKVWDTAPPGYDPMNYEYLGRAFANAVGAGRTPTVDEVFKYDQLFASSYYDMNNAGNIGTDLPQSGTEYVAATTYAQRAVVFQKVRDHVLGFLYFLASDSRVNAGVKASLDTFGMADNHYLDPGPYGVAYFPGQLYVREHRRMLGDIVWNANDLAMTDGTVPRSTKTIAVASYWADSHFHHRWATNTRTGSWEVINEGSFFVSTLGADRLAPLPREIFIPKQAECTNLGVAFAASCTHGAFSVVRMELTSVQAAQCLSVLCALAMENGDQDLAAVDDTAFRARMASIVDGTKPTLPQVN